MSNKRQKVGDEFDDTQSNEGKEVGNDTQSNEGTEFGNNTQSNEDGMIEVQGVKDLLRPVLLSEPWRERMKQEYKRNAPFPHCVLTVSTSATHPFPTAS